MSATGTTLPSASTSYGLSGPVEVALQETREHRRGMLGWSLGLAVLAAFQLSVYPTVKDQAAGMQQLVDQMPEALKSLLGTAADYTTGPGYLQTEMFGFFVPLVLITIGIARGAECVAGEEERGTLELLMATPVRRGAVVVAKAVAVLVAVLVVAAALAVTLLVGAPLVGLSVAAADVVTACAAAGLLGLLFGMLALVVGASTGSRPAGLGVGAGGALAAYLVQALAPLADWLEPWARFSPFHLTAGSVTGGVGVPDLLVLAVGSALLVAVAVAGFGHRDLR
ncbi:MAG TPA: ABC transporter permease subunit [Motilibacteraceae bacterium]|nr:ABC transporter permease subunit [Motilibacteraceae bacterium]